MAKPPMSEAIPVLVLFGPTASGKTAILEQLFSGACSRAEVISADSMQVYRGMDIGTAKPSPELLAKLPHHLIDIRDPGEQFNAGDFVRMADDCIHDIAGRGKLPVVSGGTGFYLSNFVLGLPLAPPSDAAVRLALQAELREKGAAPLRAELAAHDPVSAGRIHENDEYRLLRALEVFRVSGRPLSSFPRPCSGGTAFRPGYRFLLIGLKRHRAELYRLINERCAARFRAGLPAEVRRLFEAGYRPQDPGMKAIGYREFFISDDPDGPSANWRLAEDLVAVEALVAQNSRRYAKRQVTYFTTLPGVSWVPAGKTAPAQIQAELERFLKR
jgi:tRNA dimethylallyltransferase